MNAMYLGGHVVWQNNLPRIADKGRLIYYLPEDKAPSVGHIQFPVLNWPNWYFVP